MKYKQIKTGDLILIEPCDKFEDWYVNKPVIFLSYTSECFFYVMSKNNLAACIPVLTSDKVKVLSAIENATEL